MKAVIAACSVVFLIVACGGRNVPTVSAGSEVGIGEKIAGTWFRVGKECDGKGDNCVSTTDQERAMRWLLSRDGTGSVTDNRAGSGINIPITYTVSGNVITEKDSGGNTFVNTVISVTDKAMVVDQPYQDRRIVNRYQKVE